MDTTLVDYIESRIVFLLHDLQYAQHFVVVIVSEFIKDECVKFL